MDEFGLSTRMRKKLDSLPPPSLLVPDYPKDLIRLDHEESTLLRPELVDLYKRIVADNMNEDVLSYPPGFGGDPVLLKAFATFFNEYFHPSFEVTPDHISTSSGSGNSLDALFCTICEDGDAIMICGPCWFGYGLYMKLHTIVKPIIVNSPDFRDSMSEENITRLETAYDACSNITRIKALIVCNPNSPIDECYSEKVLRGLMAFCYKRNMHYISDETHALCAFNSPEVPFISALSLLKSPSGEATEAIKVSHTHVVWSLSKDFGSPGVRMGCIVSQANKPLLTGVTYSSFWQTSTLSSLYAIALLTSPKLPTLVELNTARLQSSYNMITTALKKWDINYIPTLAGVSIWAKLAPTATSWEEEAAMVKILKDNGVLVTAGKQYMEIYEEKGWMRILFAVQENVMKEVIRRMEKILNRGHKGFAGFG